MLSSCLDNVLAELPFDLGQQHAIIELLTLTNAEIVQDNDTQCNNEETLEWLVRTTQTEFFTRTEERYGLKIPQWIEENVEKILDIIKRAGFIAEVQPKTDDISCLAILGATGTEIQKRITFTKQLLDTFHVPNVFLLTGERYSTQGCSTTQLSQNETCGFILQDGGQEYLLNLATQMDKTLFEITETDIMVDQYQKIILDSNSTYTKPYVIDTPKENKARPDTADTVVHFMKSTEFEQCRHTVFVSRAPNIKAQDLSIKKVYADKQTDKTLETVGAAANLNEVYGKPTSAAHHILMPIAGVIYGSYIEVCKKLVNNQEKCNTLYLSTQLSFKALKDKAKLSKRDLETPANKDL